MTGCTPRAGIDPAWLRQRYEVEGLTLRQIACLTGRGTTAVARALRRIEPTLQHLAPGDVIDDWGGRDATFTIVEHTAPTTLVHRSQRGDLRISWTIVLRPEGAGSRVHLRFRIAGVRRVWLVRTGGELMDLLTVAGLAAGLRERVPYSAAES